VKRFVDPVVQIMRRIARIDPRLKDVMDKEIRLREEMVDKEKWTDDWKNKKK